MGLIKMKIASLMIGIYLYEKIAGLTAKWNPNLSDKQCGSWSAGFNEKPADLDQHLAKFVNILPKQN